MTQPTSFNRGDYGLLYHQVFGKEATRENCRAGWERWQKVWQDEPQSVLVVHPHGEAPPDAASDDYYLLAFEGPLRFVARASVAHFRRMPQLWEEFARKAEIDKLSPYGPRACARAYLRNVLIDGYVLDPTMGSAMAASIAWLVTTSEQVGFLVGNYHAIGYDISHVPGPPGRARMFNFRLIMAEDLDRFDLQTMHALPLPKWQSPPS